FAEAGGAIGFRLCQQDAPQRTPRRTQFGIAPAHLIQALELELVHLFRHAMHALEGKHANRTNGGGNEGDDDEAKDELRPNRQTGKPVHRINNPSKKEGNVPTPDARDSSESGESRKKSRISTCSASFAAGTGTGCARDPRLIKCSRKSNRLQAIDKGRTTGDFPSIFPDA